MKNQIINTKILAPVLLIGFNRPDTVSKVFDKIRESKPKKLYIAVDGPRAEKEGEDKLVGQVKKIVENVDWTCETHYKYNKTNKGAEITVSEAINWVLEREEYVIIIEDDIIAPLSFLMFAEEMLIKYKDEERIGLVSGCNFTPITVPGNKDYFFAKYGHTWGWATWRRAWQGFDLYADIKQEHLKLSFLKTITNSTKEAKYYKSVFKRMKKKGVGNNTWDFILLYKLRIENRLSIIPRVNLTSNIGIYGLHARGLTKHHFRPYDKSFKVKNHPEKIEYFKDYDVHHFKNYILANRTPLWRRVTRKLKKLYRV